MTTIEQASFNPRNGLVVPAPAPDSAEAVDAVVATGELAGAARALRFYGSVAAEGSYLQAAIDHAAPGRRTCAA
jgi:hypothetical protein